MHRPPAVSFSVVRSQWHLRLLAIVWLLGLSAAWTFAENQALSGVVAVSLSVLAAGLIALFGWRNASVGTLRWDGQDWHWSGFDEDALCQLVLQLDFQKLLLVSVTDKTKNRVVRLWLEAVPGDIRWISLRRAVMDSRRSSNAESAASRPLADGGLP
jgi:toxin CptA